MIVSHLSSADVVGRAVRALGLDPEAVDIRATEALCAALRRAASFMCPATPRQLVDAVRESLEPLEASVTRESLNELIDLLIASGDLLEVLESADQTTRQLYLGPPSYVVKSPGRCLLIGIRPFGAPILEGTIGELVDHEGHTRSIEMDPADMAATLTGLGLHEIRRDQWIRQPAEQDAVAVVRAHQDRLNAAPMTGTIDGLTILDTAAPVRYYHGRWREAKATDSGDFVGRRAQAYGADLWCVVRLTSGVPTALLDLPLSDHEQPGRFEAWRLQAAFDAVAGHPQRYRVRAAVGNVAERMLDVFSPLPGWAERNLELAGMAMDRSTGALISYRLPVDAVAEVEEFLATMLWMAPVDEGGS